MNIRLISMLVMTFAAPSALADEVSELRTGCREAVAVYDKRGEGRFWAAQTTSASEALRAGYCRGIVREYLRTARPCPYGRDTVNNWREMAARLAKTETGQAGTLDAMLRLARCGY